MAANRWLSAPFPYRGKTCYDADNGTGVASPIPPRRLPRTLTGPNDQRRDPANKNQPDYQHKDHSSILLSASSEGPGYYPGLSCFEAQVLRAGTRFFTFQGKPIE
jgi:hypothetical protein